MHISSDTSTLEKQFYLYYALQHFFILFYFFINNFIANEPNNQTMTIRNTAGVLMDELLPGKETSGSRDQRRDQKRAAGDALHAAHRYKEDERVINKILNMLRTVFNSLSKMKCLLFICSGWSECGREHVDGRR